MARPSQSFESDDLSVTVSTIKAIAEKVISAAHCPATVVSSILKVSSLIWTRNSGDLTYTGVASALWRFSLTVKILTARPSLPG